MVEEQLPTIVDKGLALSVKLGYKDVKDKLISSF